MFAELGIGHLRQVFGELRNDARAAGRTESGPNLAENRRGRNDSQRVESLPRIGDDPRKRSLLVAVQIGARLDRVRARGGAFMSAAGPI